MVDSPEPSEGTILSNSDFEDDNQSVASQKSVCSANSQLHIPFSADVNDNVTPSKNSGNHSGGVSQHQMQLKQEHPSPTSLPLDPAITIKEEKVSEDSHVDSTHSMFPINDQSPEADVHNSSEEANVPVDETDPTPSALNSSNLNPASGTNQGVPTGIIGSDGKIDLEFYLNQAIQSASMPCPLCFKEFRSQSGLRDHIRGHTGERPYICDYCHMTFARLSHLKRHRRMHTGEKPFICPICAKAFSRGDKLKDHKKRHDSEDKLGKIRSQLYKTEDCSQGSVSSGASLASASSPSLVQRPGPASPVVRQTNENTGGCVSNTAIQIGETMANLVAHATTQAVTPDSIMSAKTSVTNALIQRQIQIQQQVALQALQNQVQQHQMIPANNKRELDTGDDQTDLHPRRKKGPGSVLPHMLGVPSIGECVLSPIN